MRPQQNVVYTPVINSGPLLQLTNLEYSFPWKKSAVLREQWRCPSLKGAGKNGDRYGCIAAMAAIDALENIQQCRDRLDLLGTEARRAEFMIERIYERNSEYLGGNVYTDFTEYNYASCGRCVCRHHW